MSNFEETEDFEWEEWNPKQNSFSHHVIAGSIAGLGEHISLFPIDTIKTHIQSETRGSVNPMETWKSAVKIMSNGGILRLWRGVGAMFAGCIPAHAAYFSVFESSKVILGADKAGHHPVEAAICGALAALSHDAFMVPFDLIKQRMQLGYYHNVADCMRTIIRTEGMRALYVSMPTTLMMNLPYGLIMVPVNESARKILSSPGNHEVSFSVSMLAGCIAGGVAGALTNPLDVIKTRLQTQHLPSNLVAEVSTPPVLRGGVTVRGTMPHVVRNLHTSSLHIHDMFIERVLSTPSTSSSSSSGTIRTANMMSKVTNLLRGPFEGMWVVSRKIIVEEGYRGFLRGILPRVLVQAPSTAISWTIYEGMKSLLSEGKTGGALNGGNMGKFV